MKAIQYLVWLGGVLAAAVVLHWTDPYHALYGAAQLALLITVVWLARRSTNRRPKAVRAKEPPLFAHVVYGAMQSAITVCLLSAGFALLNLVGAPNPFEDPERIAFELRLAELEKQGAVDEAIGMIDQELPKVQSENRRIELQSRLFVILVGAGNQRSANERVTRYCQRAVEAAISDHEALLAHLLLEQAVQRDTLKAARIRYREAGQWPALAQLLTAVLTLKLEHQWDGGAGQELVDVLIEQGRSATSLQDAQTAFRKAHEVAQQLNLDSRSATTLSEEIDTLHDLQARGEFRDLIAILKQRMERFPPRQSANMLYKAIVSLAATQELLEDKRALYEEAIELARKHELASEEATRRRNSVRAELAERAAVLEQVEALRNQEKFAELIDFLQRRIAARPQREWHFPLAQWTLDAYCRLADRSELRVRIDVCREAKKFAAKYGLDVSDINSRLSAAEQEHHRQKVFLAKIRELNHQRRFTELISILQVHAESPRGEWLCSADKAIYQTWLAWGDATPDLSKKLSRYQQAVKTAKQYSLDGKEAQAKVTQVQAEVSRLEQLAADRNRPRDLPLGAKAHLLRVSTDPYPPSLRADMQVLDTEGEPIKSLEPKDFTVKLNEKIVKTVALAPIEQQGVPLSVLICLDTSASTQNSLPVAISGTKQLVNRMEMANASVKIAAFNTEMKTVCGWTSNKVELCQRMDSLKPGGKTALFGMIATGAGELSKRDGERCIVIFTDGSNTFGDVTLGEVLAACRRANVQVHAIGLRTTDLDSHALLTLAKETGGRYMEATSTSELSSFLADTSSRVRQHYYRLILTPEPSVGPIEARAKMCISVGRKNRLDVAREIHVGEPAQPKLVGAAKSR